MMIKNPLVIIQQPEVGKLILKVCPLAGLRKEKLAISLDITYSTVSFCKNGYTRPSCLGCAQARLKRF